MDILVSIVTLIVSFVSSIFSGVAGVGGGFIMAPYWLLIGLSPAQAATTGSFMVIGMGLSSLTAFKNKGHFPNDRKLVVTMSLITLSAALLGATLLPYIDVSMYKNAIASITLLSLPVLLLSKVSRKDSKLNKSIGILLASVTIFLGSVLFNAAFSILLAIILKSFLGLSILQGTLLRRIINTTQAAVIFSVLALSGNFVVHYAVIGLLGGITGCYLGTKIALHGGERFAKFGLIIGASVSSLVLIISS